MMDSFIVCRMQHGWILTFALFNLEHSSRAQVHPGTIRYGIRHQLKCDPMVPGPRLPGSTGHLEERGRTSPFQPAAYTRQCDSEQEWPSHHP